MDKRILIVDDDDNMRAAMKETVLRMGINVETADDGRNGYDKALKNKYDLIISDMRMPEVDGMEMFNLIRAAGIDTPICFVTAFGTVGNAVEALKYGALDYILKPFPPEAMEQLIHRAFDLEKIQPSNDKTQSSSSKNKTIFKSSYMTQLFALAKDVADSEATVLITGASGTGKEVFAKYIHEHSGRAKGPFVAVNCAAIPENLIESELFGFEKGAFTGAVNKKLGKFEVADKGTILLDEIGEIPISLQAKLLRVLQEKEIERLGSTKTQKVDVRILATTNRNLKTQVETGDFREDLYYRLNVINIELPPLCERKDDIEALVAFFLKRYSDINHKQYKELSKSAFAVLLEYDWPGNVRELEHTVERAVVLSKGSEITDKDLFIHGITFKNVGNLTGDSIIDSSSAMDSSQILGEASVGKTISEVERDLILNTIKDFGGNRTKAAEVLGVTVRTLRNKLNEYRANGIDVDEFLS